MIDLSSLRVRRMVPEPLRTGGTVSGPLGGSQTINRMGDRWSFLVDLPTVDLEPEGREWSDLVDAATREGGLIPIRQPRLNVGAPGSPVAASAVAAGRTVPISGLTAGYVLRRGQWISLVIGGQRFADKVAVQVTASAGGLATLTLRNLLRRPVPAGTVIEIASPKVQGSVVDVSPDVDGDETTQISFRIVEDD